MRRCSLRTWYTAISPMLKVETGNDSRVPDVTLKTELFPIALIAAVLVPDHISVLLLT